MLFSSYFVEWHTITVRLDFFYPIFFVKLHLYRPYPLLQYGDPLVLEGLAELHDLSPLRVDGERGNDQVGFLLNQLANEAGPFL